MMENSKLSGLRQRAKEELVWNTQGLSEGIYRLLE